MGKPKIVEVRSDMNEHVTAVAHTLNHSVTALGTAEGVVKVIRNDATSASNSSTTFKVPAHVTALSWCSPEQGRILAVGTAQGHLQIWTQQPTSDPNATSWGSVRCQFQHDNRPLRSIAFAPKQLGLVVACCGEEGVVRIYEADQPLDPQSWMLQSSFQASSGPCTCLCWQEYSQGVPPLLAVGSDRGAHLWIWNTPEMRWQRYKELVSEPVAALHWAPTMGRDHELVAVAVGAAVRVVALRLEGGELRVADAGLLHADSPVWRVEWNMLGTMLACSTSSCEVQLWQEALDGRWDKMTCIRGSPDAGAAEEVD